MEIRQAEYDDIPHFLTMGRKFAEVADEPFDRESLTQHLEWILEDEHTTAFIVFDGDQAVGIVAGIWIPTFWDNSKITATELWWWVEEEHRMSGVGTMLMDALESWAKQVGAWRLGMMTIVGLAPGVEEIYRKRGFRPRENTFVKEL
jgi:GNAT superfamily N-acetyltransferase